MRYSVISTILNILPTTAFQYQESMFIRNLNGFFEFDQNIFLLDSFAEVDRFMPPSTEPLKDYTPRSVYIFKSVVGNVSTSETIKEIQSKNTFLIVASGSSGVDNNLKLLVRIKKIQRLQMNMKIGLFFSHIISTDNIRELFDWCWKEQIVHIFAAFYASYDVVTESSSSQRLLNIFTYNPFGTFMTNVTGTKSFENIFLSKNCNFHQHPIRTAILKNTWSQNSKDSLNYELANEKLWRSVFHVLNASVAAVQVNYNMEPSQMFDSFDIFAYLYRNKEQEIVKIYPMTSTPHSIVVPEALPYKEFAAYLKKITSDNFFAYSLVTISAVWLLLIAFRYIKLKKYLFLESACDVVNLLINDNGAIKYRQLSWQEIFIILPLTFSGFVIVSGVLSALQSFLTRPIIQPQIDSVEDIYLSPFPILTWDEYWANRLTCALESLSVHRDWRDKIHVPGYSELYRLITTYNTSMSFCWEEPRAKVLCQLQKRFNIRGYHISQTRTFNALDSYPVNDVFPFIERVNNIIHWIRNAGLYERWRQEEYSAIMKDVLASRSKLVLRSEESEIDKFPLPMFICYGWCAGIIVLFMEIVYKRFKLEIFVSRAFKKI